MRRGWRGAGKEVSPLQSRGARGLLQGAAGWRAGPAPQGGLHSALGIGCMFLPGLVTGGRRWMLGAPLRGAAKCRSRRAKIGARRLGGARGPPRVDTKQWVSVQSQSRAGPPQPAAPPGAPPARCARAQTVCVRTPGLALAKLARAHTRAQMTSVHTHANGTRAHAKNEHTPHTNTHTPQTSTTHTHTHTNNTLSTHTHPCVFKSARSCTCPSCNGAGAVWIRVPAAPLPRWRALAALQQRACGSRVCELV